MTVSLLSYYDLLIAYHNGWHTTNMYKKYKYLFSDGIKNLGSSTGVQLTIYVMLGRLLKFSEPQFLHK